MIVFSTSSSRGPRRRRSSSNALARDYRSPSASKTRRSCSSVSRSTMRRSLTSRHAAQEVTRLRDRSHGSQLASGHRSMSYRMNRRRTCSITFRGWTRPTLSSKLRSWGQRTNRPQADRRGSKDMAGPAEFERNMRRHGRNVERNAAKMVRKAALAIDTAVVLATPVDTGRARSNWQASLSAPLGTAIEAYVPGQAGSTAAPNASAAMDQARGVISTHKPGQAIYLTNNLPYIGKLNDGHSAQAPSGFVQKAVLVGAQAIRGFSVVKETRR